MRKVRGKRSDPIIIREKGEIDPYQSTITFVCVCGPNFDQKIPNAATTARLGFCHGFEKIGIPYLMLSVFDLERRLPEIPYPICWISGSDYIYLSPQNEAALKKHRHIVWINTWFERDVDFYHLNDYPNNSLPDITNKKILSTEPDFVFTISPECSFEYYELWIKNGARLVSLPLALDTSLYHKNAPLFPEFNDIEMAFVGGYWPYKARQFDQYLKPYESRLKVFGYSPWPYAGYSGVLSRSKESSLYRQARLSPTINEPHVETMGIDLNERVFKVLGSGGMTVTDITPAYREWFSPDELLVPESKDEYHMLVHATLTDDNFNRSFRRKGYQAVIQRHTYEHRASLILSLLGI
jgi:hypothetical protein